MMERTLFAIWNWLPAFRAVAETEHLPTAARRLNLTTSALSRSIRNLEDAMGQSLFDRRGRSLVLNANGQRLLAAIKEAHRVLGAGVSAIAQEPMQGRLRVASLSVLTNDFVLPPLLELMARHGGLQPTLLTEGPRDANALLARAQLDVAFLYDALAHDDVVLERIGTATASIYCGRGHPLFERASEETSIDAVLAHPFSVPMNGDRGLPRDRWPIEIPRRVGIQLSTLATNLPICSSGQLLAVLLDAVAAPLVTEDRVRRIPLEVIPPIELHAARARAAGPAPLVDELIAGVRARAAAVSLQARS